MKTYLVPIDFSEAAVNAAHFAAALTRETDSEYIVLMNAYYISEYEALLPDTDMMMLREQEIEENAADRLRRLEKLKRKLQKEVPANVNIRVKLNRSHLLRAVVDTVADNDVDVVFLGSKGNSSAGQPGLGSHVVKVSKACPVPVVVVPPDYKYKPINSAVIACDFKQVTGDLSLTILSKFLTNQPVKLLVVNIDNDKKITQTDAAQLAGQTALHDILKAYNPHYHHVNNNNVITGILNFASNNDAGIVIALPHKYSFLQSLVHSSISRQLAANSTVPVLLLK